MRAVLENALDVASRGDRLDRDQARVLYEQAGLHELAGLAHGARMAHHPDNMVTYVCDRNINYSNVCSCGCKFCAFFRAPGDEQGYVMEHDELGRKIEETIAVGGTQILMQGGHHPDLPLLFYTDMLGYIRTTFPSIHVHAFSPPEIVYFSNIWGMSVREVLKEFIAAGLHSIPGGGAEILVDRVRTAVAPNKCNTDAWLGVMREAHQLGLRTSATMMFGHLDTPEDRLEHLFRLRELQDETSGFTAFIPWTFQPSNTALSDIEPATSVEYLRLLALSRLVLDNFDNVQVSWVTMGPKIAQLALFYGANDFGSTMLEENVVAAAGVSFRLSREEIEFLVREAGFTPRQRRMDYSLVESTGAESSTGGAA
ncbi:MAG: cyclic dehypoxanthinyl futalosine synthase [Desulfovibrio sp.]|uniref:cyclic dehypoxanthinyl futalosine synthase n=1 Tax=Desulfovibrio sp. 7SRBS1 TaxID=3378064 RepID=UPI003B41A834